MWLFVLTAEREKRKFSVKTSGFSLFSFFWGNPFYAGYSCRKSRTAQADNPCPRRFPDARSFSLSSGMAGCRIKLRSGGRTVHQRPKQSSGAGTGDRLRQRRGKSLSAKGPSLHAGINHFGFERHTAPFQLLLRAGQNRLKCFHFPCRFEGNNRKDEPYPFLL